MHCKLQIEDALLTGSASWYKLSMSTDLAILYQGRFLSLVQRGAWQFVTRRNICGIVGIIAVTADNKLLLVEQFRPPLNAICIELPAGLAGDHAGCESEPLEIAAGRELEEETGYTAGSFEQVAAGATSAGLSDEVITLFVARDLAKTHPGPTDHSENITLHEVLLDQVPAFLTRQQKLGKQIDMKVYAGLYFAGRP